MNLPYDAYHIFHSRLLHSHHHRSTDLLNHHSGPTKRVMSNNWTPPSSSSHNNMYSNVNSTSPCYQGGGHGEQPLQPPNNGKPHVTIAHAQDHASQLVQALGLFGITLTCAQTEMCALIVEAAYREGAIDAFMTATEAQPFRPR